MKKIGTTPPQAMSTQKLVAEHTELDNLVGSWGSAPQVTDFDVQAVKRRRCSLKTEAIKRAEGGDLEAMAYSDTRSWGCQFAA